MLATPTSSSFTTPTSSRSSLFPIRFLQIQVHELQDLNRRQIKILKCRHEPQFLFDETPRTLHVKCTNPILFPISSKHTFPFNQTKHFLQQSLRFNTKSPIPKLNPKTATAFQDAIIPDKLRRLASEFQSLSEPIDRVKRLLHYATLLPPLQDSDRVPKNRVSGCTTEVWVVAEMDKRSRRMRFRADSDSQISKGFCWCLIWMLDGAEAEEVLTVETEDLVDINVGGSHVKAQSRVNTWLNVLFSMQKATKALVVEMDTKKPIPPSFFLAMADE